MNGGHQESKKMLSGLYQALLKYDSNPEICHTAFRVIIIFLLLTDGDMNCSTFPYSSRFVRFTVLLLYNEAAKSPHLKSYSLTNGGKGIV
jgi:hypothetical protein